MPKQIRDPETSRAARTPSQPQPGRRGRRQRLRLIAAVVLLGLALLATLAARRAGELEMSVSLPGPAFIQGRPIDLTIRVTNRSGRDLRLNTFSPFDRKDCRVLEGQPVVLQLYEEPYHRPSLRVPYGLEGEVPQGVLEAGGSMELVCDVGQLFGLVQTGKHTLDVTYVRDPWAGGGWPGWLPRLVSSSLGPETVELEITPLYR